MAILDARKIDTFASGHSFSLGNRIYRAVWSVVWLVFASWTPPQLRPWRRWLLRLFGATIAPTANIYASARIWSPANLSVGDYACIGPRVRVYSMAKVSLAAYSLA